MLSQAVAVESCDSAPKRKEDCCCPRSMALEAKDVDWGVTFCLAETGGKIVGAIQV